jgi:hypothetical protein
MGRVLAITRDLLLIIFQKLFDLMAEEQPQAMAQRPTRPCNYFINDDRVGETVAWLA